MSNCRSCKHWQPERREVDEEARCDEIRDYVRTWQPRGANLFTLATFSCGQFATTSHSYDEFAERLAEGWSPGPSWVTKESQWS